MPLNLPQSFMAGTFALSGKALMSPPRAVSSVYASKEAAGMKHNAAGLAMQSYQVLRLALALCQWHDILRAH